MEIQSPFNKLDPLEQVVLKLLPARQEMKDLAMNTADMCQEVKGIIDILAETCREYAAEGDHSTAALVFKDIHNGLNAMTEVMSGRIVRMMFMDIIHHNYAKDEETFLAETSEVLKKLHLYGDACVREVEGSTRLEEVAVTGIEEMIRRSLNVRP